MAGGAPGELGWSGAGRGPLAAATFATPLAAPIAALPQMKPAGPAVPVSSGAAALQGISAARRSTAGLLASVGTPSVIADEGDRVSTSMLLRLPPRLVATHIVRGRLLPWEAGQLALTCRRGRVIACASIETLVLRDARFAGGGSGSFSGRPSSAGGSGSGLSSAGGSGVFATASGGLTSAGPSGNWWGSAVAAPVLPPPMGSVAAALVPRSRRQTEDQPLRPPPFTSCTAVVLRPRTMAVLSKIVTGLLLPGVLRARLPALSDMSIEVHDVLSSQCDLSLQLTSIALQARGVARMRIDQPGLFTVREALAVTRMGMLEALIIKTTEVCPLPPCCEWGKGAKAKVQPEVCLHGAS
jgi:hypothetical protein